MPLKLHPVLILLVSLLRDSVTSNLILRMEYEPRVTSNSIWYKYDFLA